MKKNEEKIRKEEMAKLLSDYHRDNAYIARQKYKWLEPKEKKPNEKTTKQK